MWDNLPRQARVELQRALPENRARTLTRLGDTVLRVVSDTRNIIREVASRALGSFKLNSPQDIEQLARGPVQTSVEREPMPGASGSERPLEADTKT